MLSCRQLQLSITSQRESDISMEIEMTFKFPDLTAVKHPIKKSIEMLSKCGQLVMEKRAYEHPFFVAQVEGSSSERYEISLPLWVNVSHPLLIILSRQCNTPSMSSNTDRVS